MTKDKQRFSNDIQIRNRKARYEHEFLEIYEAGVVLKGTEIKSLREGKASIQEAYCYIHRNEVFIKGMTISPYSESSFQSHDQQRERKLLLKKREIQKLKSKTEEKGLTLIPAKVYINKRGFAKVQVALARGKKLYDKRDSIKKKDQKRELERMRIV